MSELGKLERVLNIKSEWADEARDFTPWIATEGGLALIGETLNFGSDWLELVETEASVGSFRADIVCRDAGREDHFIVIENQFGPSDHDHLGKLLTYAAGQKAKTIIWIAERIRDEHRAAVDLLNDATTDDFQFFALEIELWKIGDSPIAPRFNVIAKPNDWSRTIAKKARGSATANLTELKRTYIDYWSSFKEYLGNHSTLRCQKPAPQPWMFIPIGRSNITLTASLNSRENWIQVFLELHGENAASFYKLLRKQKNEIDAESNYHLNWEELPNQKSAKISIRQNGVNPTDRSNWEEQHEWQVVRLNDLHKLFQKRVKELDISVIFGE